mgnify:FL=1|jgi:hypothetical protein|tara:strand:- start:75 stop:254 length:180 start_codon:yes stop_codon:yes gene_type:complete
MKRSLQKLTIWTFFKYPKILKININFNDGGLWPWEVNSSKFISSPYDNKKTFITERELK